MSSREPNLNILVLGYGSLMSGYGLLAERRGGRYGLTAIDAEPLAVRNARRGLAKPSSHGSYLAMDIEPRDRTAPITARAGASNAGDGTIGALLLTFERAQAPRIAEREEYRAAALLELIDLADRAGVTLGEYLKRIAERTRFDLLEYRRAIRDLIGYTSRGYVFHPVPLDDGRVAIVAIGSGFEGSGDPEIVSRRREFGIDRLYGLASALAIATLPMDRMGQIGYHAECLLAGMHGIGVGDLIDGFEGAQGWVPDLAAAFARAASHETERFMRATSLDSRRYRERFASIGADPSLEPLLKLARLG